MADYDQIMKALRNADAAGDVEGAKRLAKMAVAAKSTPPAAAPAAAPERGLKQRLYDNIVGDPNDGVTSTGEALGTWLNRAGESMTLGVVGDEASALAGSALPGRTYEGELKRYRDNEDGMSTAGQITADIGGALLPAAFGVGLVSQAPTVLGRMMTGAGLGAGAGAVQGFAEGEGDIDKRVTGGLLGGVIGGGIGGAIPGAAEVARQGWRAVQGSHLANSIGKQIGGALDVSPQAGRFLGRSLAAEDQGAMSDAVQRAGPGAMLADASPAMAARLDGAMQSPVPGARVAAQRVNQRAGDAYYNTMDAVQGGVQGPALPVEAQMRQIRTSTARARGDAYDAAYSREIDWRSPAGENLRNLIDTTPPEVMQAAGRSRGMAVTPRPQVPESAYPEFAPVVTRGTGPESALTQEGEEIGQFFDAYGQATGRQVRRPLSRVIEGLGGVDPNSPAGRELKNMGLTSRNSPSLFRKGGLKDLDNLDPQMFPDVIQSQGDGTGNYMDRNALLQGISDEWNGRAVRSADDMLDSQYADEMERLVPEYEARDAALRDRLSGPDAPEPYSEFVPTKTVEDIDFIKRQLDAIVDTNEGMGKLGGLTPYGLNAKDRAVAIREALKEAAPGYANALETAADPIRRRQAVEFGSKLLRPNTTTEEALQEIANATGGELKSMRQGVIAQVRETLGNVRAVASDPNIDARQASAALRELSSPNAQTKMQALYGDAWPAVKKSIDEAQAALGLRANTSSNSATFARQAVDRELTEDLQPSAIRQMKPLKAASDFVASLSGASPSQIARVRDEVKGELADILTRQGGAPQEIIDKVQAIMARNPENPNAGNAIGRLLTGAGFAALPGVNERLQVLSGLSR